MFFEAMDLYGTLDMKSNPMDSSHWMSLVSRGLIGVIIALWRPSLNNGEVIMRTSYLLLRN